MSDREKWPPVIPITEATGQFLSPDVETTTRVDFTEFFQRFQCLPDAHPVYKHLFEMHQQLAKLLIEHPAMKPNLQQTFSTPANSKNKVYFTWDFILRTFQFLAARVEPLDPYRSEMFVDVLGRSTAVKHLVLDTTGQLDAMNASVGYSDDEGVEFTDEIKALIDKLDELPPACAGCGRLTKEDGGDLLRCARCKDALYCSAACQKALWKFHKKECVPLTGA